MPDLMDPITPEEVALLEGRKKFVTEAELREEQLERARRRDPVMPPRAAPKRDPVYCHKCHKEITDSPFAHRVLPNGAHACGDYLNCLRRTGELPPKPKRAVLQRDSAQPVGEGCSACGALAEDGDAIVGGLGKFSLASTTTQRVCAVGCAVTRALGLDAASMQIRAAMALANPDLATANSRAWGEFVALPATDPAFGVYCNRAKANCGERGGALQFIIPELRHCIAADCPPAPEPIATAFADAFGDADAAAEVSEPAKPKPAAKPRTRARKPK